MSAAPSLSGVAPAPVAKPDRGTVPTVPPPTADGVPEQPAEQPATTADGGGAQVAAQTPTGGGEGKAPEGEVKSRQRGARGRAKAAGKGGAPAATDQAPTAATPPAPVQTVVATPAAALGYVAPDAGFAPPPGKLIPPHLHAAARSAALNYVKARIRSLTKWDEYGLAVAGIRALGLPPEQGGMGLPAEAVEYALASLAAETGAPVPPPPAAPAAEGEDAPG
jgi:hypothetical protein